MAAPPLILLQRANGTNVPFQAKDFGGFNDLRTSIQSKCPELTNTQQFKFDVGGFHNVSLLDDDEFSSMLMLSSLVSPPVVYLSPIVEFASSCPATVTPTEFPNQRKSTTPLSQNNHTQPRCSQRNAVQTTLPQFHKTTKPRQTGSNSSTTKKNAIPFSQPSSTPTSSTSRQFTPPSPFSDSFNSGNNTAGLPDLNQPSDSSPTSHTESTSPTNFMSQTNIPNTWANLNDSFANGEYTTTDTSTAYSSPSQFTSELNNDSDSECSQQPNSDDIVHQQEKKERRALMKKENKRARTERNAKGDWYPGVHDQVPRYDISKPPPPTTLMSEGWLKAIKGVGQEFEGGVKHFRAELVKYSSKLGFHFDFTKNDSEYVHARCKLHEESGCNWFVRGAVHSVTKTFFIKTADLSHTCRLSILRNDTSRLSAKIIADIIQPKVQANPTVKPCELVDQLLVSHGFEIEYMKVWRGVEEARSTIYGNYRSSFDQLTWYSAALQKRNPGSIVALDCEDNTHQFKRFFFAFKGCLEGFKKCRPLLFVDGTFMKNRYKGTILAATAKDGNNGLFPVALAIVSSENTNNWIWFINLIKQHVKHDQPILYISDRAGGILAAFDMLQQKSHHFFCLWHLMKNLREKYSTKLFSDLHRNTMCKFLKDLAYAPNERCFHEAMIPFLQLGGDIARKFLEDLPVERWAVAYAPDLLRYGELTSSAAESFNKWILDARKLPITFLIDTIRHQLMKWFVDRQEDGRKCSNALTDAKQDEWNKDFSTSSTWTIRTAHIGEEYEVLSEPTTIVNLRTKTCTCFHWQINGFPCCHAIAVISRGKFDIRDYIEPYFFTDNYRQTYLHKIHPIPTTDRHEYAELISSTPTIIPPAMPVGAGRPQVKRFQKAKTPRPPKQICERCGTLGRHDWSTCGKILDEAQPPSPSYRVDNLDEFDYNQPQN